MHFYEGNYTGRGGEERVVVETCPVGTINVALCATKLRTRV